MEEKAMTPADVKKDLFSRWLFAWLEQLACGVLMLPGVAELRIDAIGYKEAFNFVTILQGTEWQLPYLAVLILFFAAVAYMAMPLFADRLRKGYVLVGMIAAQAVFLAVNIATFVIVSHLAAQKTFYGLPYDCTPTVIGMIYPVVSGFAVAELVLTWRTLRKASRVCADVETQDLMEDSTDENP